MFLNKSKQWVFSPSDVTVFLNSPFASWMDRAKIEDTHLTDLANESDPFMSLLAQKGYEHKEQYFNTLKKDRTLSIIDITEQDNSDPVSATLEAMQQGYDIIFQATLESKKMHFKGHADYLNKIAKTTAWGLLSFKK